MLGVKSTIPSSDISFMENVQGFDFGNDHGSMGIPGS
jgi:hypothetical protein